MKHLWVGIEQASIFVGPVDSMIGKTRLEPKAVLSNKDGIKRSVHGLMDCSILEDEEDFFEVMPHVRTRRFDLTWGFKYSSSETKQHYPLKAFVQVLFPQMIDKKREKIFLFMQWPERIWQCHFHVDQTFESVAGVFTQMQPFIHETHHWENDFAHVDIAQSQGEQFRDRLVQFFTRVTR